MPRLPGAGLIALVLLASCHPTQSDLTQLKRMEEQADPRANAGEPIGCDKQDVVCVRLLVARAAACTRLTESPDREERARGRGCALRDYAAAQKLLPADAPAEDRRKVLTGLAQATMIDRDFLGTGATAAERNDTLAATAAALRATQGGLAYGAYFAADAAVFRALRATPAAEACRQLDSARQGLPDDPLPPDLAPHVRLLRATIAAASSPPVRTCS